MLKIILALCLLNLLYIFCIPFTKVEESFNIQATHDILYHGANLKHYDHFEFPGVVPRTFIGPLLLSILSCPFVVIIDKLELQKLWSQYIIRAILGGVNIYAFYILLCSLKKLVGTKPILWTAAITMTQFHFMFYLSRLLPNIMALPLTLIAITFWINKRTKLFLITSGAAILIFRSELVLLFSIFLFYDILSKKIQILETTKFILLAGIPIICATIFIDSIFWNKLEFPEAKVFWYNTFLNKSKDWGTSPFLWYFYSALPRALGTSIILTPVGLYYSKEIRSLLAACIIYIMFYSFLPHKELRFIIYVVPMFNLAAGLACREIWRRNFLLANIMKICVIGHLFANLCLTILMIIVSSHNYPGGYAMQNLHKFTPTNTNVSVYIGNLAAQTGVTRFTEINQNWNYNKTEISDLLKLTNDFDYLLVEPKDLLVSHPSSIEVIDTITCFTRLSFNKTLNSLINVSIEPCISIIKSVKRHIK